MYQAIGHNKEPHAKMKAGKLDDRMWLKGNSRTNREIIASRKPEIRGSEEIDQWLKGLTTLAGTPVRLPAMTWWLTTISNSSFRRY